MTTQPIQRVNVEKRGRHYLLPSGKLVPSITNILDILDKPALKWWAGDIERKACIQAAIDVGPDETRIRAELARKFGTTRKGRVKFAHEANLADAGDIGTELHELIQSHLKGEPQAKASENALLAFMAWEDWAQRVSLEPIHVETMLGSDLLGVGGTLDCAAHAAIPAFRDPREDLYAPVVFDWKSSKRSKTSPTGIYPEAMIQVSVYREMAIEMGLVSDDAWAAVVRLPKSIDDPCINEKKLDVEWIEPERATKYARGFLSIADTWIFMKTEFGG